MRQMWGFKSSGTYTSSPQSGSLLSINSLYNNQWFCQRTAKVLIRLRDCFLHIPGDTFSSSLAHLASLRVTFVNNVRSLVYMYLPERQAEKYVMISKKCTAVSMKPKKGRWSRNIMQKEKKKKKKKKKKKIAGAQRSRPHYNRNNK